MENIDDYAKTAASLEKDEIVTKLSIAMNERPKRLKTTIFFRRRI